MDGLLTPALLTVLLRAGGQVEGEGDAAAGESIDEWRLRARANWQRGFRAIGKKVRCLPPLAL